MGTASSQIDSLRIIRTLIIFKGLHEFDRTLSQELLKALKGDLAGFYLYSEKAKTFAPVSDLLRNPDFPGYHIGQLPSAGTMKAALVQRGRAILENNLDIIQKRASVGLASELDVKRTEVLVAEAAGLIPDLARTRSVESHRLEVLTGMSPGSLDLHRKPLLSIVIQPNIPVGLPSQLLERRPDILQAEATLMDSNARIGQARAYFFPTLSITGQGGLQSVEFSNWFTGNRSNYSIGPLITLPIFQGGTNLARLDSAESRHVQMLESYQQTILQAFREVADLLTSLSARAEQLVRQREQLSAAQEAVRLADVRYSKGLVTYLDVLDAQRTVLTA